MSRLHSKSFVAQVGTLVTGTVAAQAIAILISPVLTRLYTPEEMGLLASFSAVTAVLGVVAAGRYDLAVVLPDDHQDALAVSLVGLIVAFIVSVFTLTAFSLFRPALTSLLGLERLQSPWVTAIGPIMFVAAAQQMLTRLHIRHRQFRPIAGAQVAQAAITSTTKIGLGLAGFGVSGLLFGTVLGNSLRVLLLVAGLVRSIRIGPIARIVHRLRFVALRYKRFPMVDIWSAVLNSASTQVPVILIATLFSPAAAGFYALSHRVLKLPVALIGQNVGQVFLERSRRASHSRDELARVTIGLYKRLLLIGAASMSMVAFFGPAVFPLVFGSQWSDAGAYARWLSFWLLFNFVSSPLSVLLVVFERQVESLLWNIVLFGTRLTVLIVGSTVIGTETATVALYSLVGAAFYCAYGFRLLRLAGCSMSVVIWTSIRTVVFVYGAVGALAWLVSTSTSAYSIY